MLQVVLGLEAGQIASAFLASPAAMAQRLVSQRRRSAKPGFLFAFRTGTNLRIGLMPCWIRSLQVLRGGMVGRGRGRCGAAGTGWARQFFLAGF